MAQLEAGQNAPPVVHCIREMRVDICHEHLAELQHFYAEVLGLPPWPNDAQIPGGWGVGHPQRGLYLQYRHDPRVDPLRRRFTLVVPSLGLFAEHLAEHDWPCMRHRGLSETDRWLLLADPIGHLIEVRESHRCV